VPGQVIYLILLLPECETEVLQHLHREPRDVVEARVLLNEHLGGDEFLRIDADPRGVLRVRAEGESLDRCGEVGLEVVAVDAPEDEVLRREISRRFRLLHASSVLPSHHRIGS